MIRDSDQTHLELKILETFNKVFFYEQSLKACESEMSNETLLMMPQHEDSSSFWHF